MKLTKQELTRIGDIASLVRGLEIELAMIKAPVLKDSVKGSLPEHPYTQCTVVVEGETVLEEDPRYKKLSKEVQEKRDEWLAKISEAEEKLADVEPEMQDILRRRYILGQTLAEIGDSKGYTAVAIHKKIKSYFEKS